MLLQRAASHTLQDCTLLQQNVTSYETRQHAPSADSPLHPTGMHTSLAECYILRDQTTSSFSRQLHSTGLHTSLADCYILREQTTCSFSRQPVTSYRTAHFFSRLLYPTRLDYMLIQQRARYILQDFTLLQQTVTSFTTRLHIPSADNQSHPTGLDSTFLGRQPVIFYRTASSFSSQPITSYRTRRLVPSAASQSPPTGLDSTLLQQPAGHLLQDQTARSFSSQPITSCRTRQHTPSKDSRSPPTGLVSTLLQKTASRSHSTGLESMLLQKTAGHSPQSTKLNCNAFYCHSTGLHASSADSAVTPYKIRRLCVFSRQYGHSVQDQKALLLQQTVRSLRTRLEGLASSADRRSNPTGLHASLVLETDNLTTWGYTSAEAVPVLG